MGGSQSKIARLKRLGDTHGSSLAFAMLLPPPACGCILALTFEVSCDTDCTVYAKPDMFETSLATREAWRAVWTGRLHQGVITVPLNQSLKLGQILSVYIHCSPLAIMYSNARPRMETLSCEFQGVDCTRQITIAAADVPAEGPFLVCFPGRGNVSQVPFSWPQ